MSLDLEDFQRFLAERGRREEHLLELRQHAERILQLAQDGDVTEQAIAQAIEEAKAEGQGGLVLQRLASVGNSLLAFQRIRKAEARRTAAPGSPGRTAGRPRSGEAQARGLLLLVAAVSIAIAGAGGGYWGWKAYRDSRDREEQAFPPRQDGALQRFRPDADVMRVYEAGRDAVRSGDLASGAAHLERAVALQPDFTEAWYNLGAALSNLAIQATRAGDEDLAVRLFRKAVDSKKRSKALMDRGVWYLYGPADQAEVRSDVQNALEDADDVLADEKSLRAALRIWALALGS